MSFNYQEHLLILQDGSNLIRMFGKPHQYHCHVVNDRVQKCSLQPDCQYCNGPSVLTNYILDEDRIRSNRIISRWMISVIDRKDQTTKILDFTSEVFTRLQHFYLDPDWGDPSQYDLNLVANTNAYSDIYSVIPKPHHPLSSADQQLVDLFTHANDMIYQCNPTTVDGFGFKYHLIGNRDDVLSNQVGATCTKCNTAYPYANSSSNFICWSCRNGF